MIRKMSKLVFYLKCPRILGLRPRHLMLFSSRKTIKHNISFILQIITVYWDTGIFISECCGGTDLKSFFDVYLMTFRAIVDQRRIWTRLFRQQEWLDRDCGGEGSCWWSENTKYNKYCNIKTRYQMVMSNLIAIIEFVYISIRIHIFNL